MGKREGRPVRKTFPVNMMIEHCRVLVVGGGRVGQRKVELLLDAGAEVVLVCPECVEELSQLACAGRISYVNRRFSSDDLSGMSLAFACTDDKGVNRAVLEAAQVAGVLCCCADGNWSEGNFVTPAIIRAGEVLIAVSTSGKSCRQSRLIKDNLRKHLDSIESSDLLILGTSHEYLGSGERAPYHLLLREREALGEMIRQVWGVHEFFILNTCNRIELAAVISKEAGTSGILRRLMRFDQLRPDLYYMKHGFDAFSHLCKVAAGMDSQVPGEVHVVSQLKDAGEEATARGWAGSIVREWLDAALRVSKDIRNELGDLLQVSEIEDVALRYFDQLSPGPSQTAVVIGTGVIGRGLVEGLLQRSCTCIWVYHVNRPEVPPEHHGRIQVVQMEALSGMLPKADVVFSAVNVQSPVVTCAEHAAALKSGGVLLIDCGIPRNIDPAFDDGAGPVRVADLDELKRWHRTISGSMDKAFSICDAVLEDHRGIYERIRLSLKGET